MSARLVLVVFTVACVAAPLAGALQLPLELECPRSFDGSPAPEADLEFQGAPADGEAEWIRDAVARSLAFLTRYPPSRPPPKRVRIVVHLGAYQDRLGTFGPDHFLLMLTRGTLDLRDRTILFHELGHLVSVYYTGLSFLQGPSGPLKETTADLIMALVTGEPYLGHPETVRRLRFSDIPDGQPLRSFLDPGDEIEKSHHSRRGGHAATVLASGHVLPTDLREVTHADLHRASLLLTRFLHDLNREPALALDFPRRFVRLQERFFLWWERGARAHFATWLEYLRGLNSAAYPPMLSSPEWTAKIAFQALCRREEAPARFAGAPESLERLVSAVTRMRAEFPAVPDESANEEGHDAVYQLHLVTALLLSTATDLEAALILKHFDARGGSRPLLEAVRSQLDEAERPVPARAA